MLFIHRLFSMVMTIWLAATLAFFALRVLPGDAIEAQLVQTGASEAEINRRRADLGLNDSLLMQYSHYFTGLLRGDLGSSLLDGLPVTELILQRFVPTATLAVGALLVAVLLGLGLGIVSTLESANYLAPGARVLINLSLATPIYWTGTLVIYLTAVVLGSSESGYLNQLFLPVSILGFHTSGAIARVVQVNIREILHSEFVQTARAKGLPEHQIIWRHVLRVGLLPVISVIALQAGFLFGGTVITENLFVRPGIGQLLLTRTIQQDYPVVQGIVILAALIYTSLMMLSDIFQRILDPRIAI